MPDAIITSTASTFGTITGTFAADQSTITGTVTGIITGTLDGSVGVPGVGVPDGGTTGQVLQKATNTSYDTVWATPSGGTWGSITGTLSNQTDLQTALNLKAPLASPGLTGVPTAPTAATLTSTTQLATTAFVQQELLSGTANARNLEVYVRNQTGSTLAAGTIVYINGATGNRPTITLAQANNDANSAQTFGFTKASIANNGFGFVIVRGELENINTSALTEGAQLYLSPTTAGTWTTTKPSAPQHLVYVGIVVRAHPTQGVILVAVQNGYELNELHDVQITSPTNGQVLKYNSSTSLWYNGLDVGIPVGGTAGQFLTKIDGTDYNTDWTTVNLSVYAVKSNNLSDLTSASTARTNLGLGTMATATAADYSTTTVANGLYYPLSTNPSGFITRASLTGYATESWVTAGFYPLTGNPSGFITSSALTPYLTSATAASTYQTLSGMSSYLTTSAAASTYAALAGATFTGVVGFNGASGNVAAKSTGYFKAYTSGAENTDYSLQYNTGFQVVVGGTTVARIASSGIVAPSAGITFSDATTQTSAGITAATAASTYAPLASPALTGNPTAPTPLTADNDTSIATTAFVKAQGYLTSAPVTSVAGKTGVVTLVVGDVSGAAPLDSPGLTGTPTAPTATAATNTTQIATTAFVTTADNLKANLASPTFTGTPAAPTATAGTNTTQIATTAFVTAAVPAFATNTQARLGSSTTLGINPNNLQAAVMSPNWSPIYRIGFTATVTGTGANATLGSTNTFYQLPTLGAVSGHSYARTYGTSQVDQLTNLWGDDANIYVNFAKRIWMSGRSLLNFPNEAVYTARVSFGKAEATGVGDLAARGIGWRYAGGASNFVQLMVHNGTTLTTVNSSFHPTGVPFDWDIVSAGDGNVTLFINGSQVATTSAGPSTRATSGQCLYQEEIGLTATSTGNFLRLYCARGAIYVQP